MRILVCVKQVPATEQVEVDPVTGVLKRDNLDARLNPYDEYALETALYIRAAAGGSVAALTMGTPAGEAVLREVYGFGVDEGYLLTDPALAGSDVLATSFALSQAVVAIGPFDLIVCGRQTTDGDTAQVGPALAEHLGIPHVSWVSRIVEIDTEHLVVEQDMLDLTANATLPYPCLITVEKGIMQPRLPSYTLLKKAEARPVKTLTLSNLAVQDRARYGLRGSPTQVEKIFPPDLGPPPRRFEGPPARIAEALFGELLALKLVT